VRAILIIPYFISFSPPANLVVCSYILDRYVGLGETDDDMQVFYYFVKSENNPQKDPLMLWISGGPGCSSFSALAFQIGNF